jgi:hypothetical protein
MRVRWALRLVRSSHSSSSTEALSKSFGVQQSLLALVRPSVEAVLEFCKFRQRVGTRVPLV